MTLYRSWISILALGSILLGQISCSSDAHTPPQSNEEAEEKALPDDVVDLSTVIEKRIEGKHDEALTLLRDLSEKYPRSIEVYVQLGRTLMDLRDFSLAAFRFEQAMSKGAGSAIARETAEAHYLSQDFDSATDRYAQYLLTNPEDPNSRLRYARLLARQGKTTESLNTFFQASEEASPEDCQLMGSLFLSKKLYPQARHWFEESNRRANGSTPGALVGMLQVALAEGREADAENLILAIEKIHSGHLETTDLASTSANLLRRRRLADLIARGVDARSMSVTELASGLLAGTWASKPPETVISAGSKLPTLVSSIEPEDEKDLPVPAPPPEPEPVMSLAEAFAAPVGEINDATGALESPVELGRAALLEARYTTALLHAREALKENSKDAKAWSLCSQAHFQLGEIDEAEMTILEAIRHDPTNLDMRTEYLRIARETLPSDRYLMELEKAREIFPDTVEILWELARRYHLVEKMPVTASILYRKVIQSAPSGSSIAQQAEIELLKIEKP